MFDEFVKQVKRLFSSKKNGGKLVYYHLDRLHYYKLILIATSLVLLLGYSQFRSNFECQEVGKIDKKTLNSFCWVNGTVTLDLKDQYKQDNEKQQQKELNNKLIDESQTNSDSYGQITKFIDQVVPHVGIHFRFNEDSKYEVINHNYMRSLWTLLILMAICSYLALISWLKILNRDILKALLKLPGNDELAFVQKAQEVRAYETLMKFSQDDKEKRRQELGFVDLFKGYDQLFQSIDLIAGDENVYNHLLDYYPNQLIYLLLSKKSKQRTLKGLKYKLFLYSLSSASFTLLQFLLPRLFIGEKYTYYGWEYLKAWLNYVYDQFTQPNSLINSIDYELSSRIWPTSASCEYKQFGVRGIERYTTQCIVPINEICAKLFVVIWLIVALNILMELIYLVINALCLIDKFALYWYLPTSTHKKVKNIAAFRQKHSRLLNRMLEIEQRKRNSTLFIPLNNNHNTKINLSPLTTGSPAINESQERRNNKKEFLVESTQTNRDSSEDEKLRMNSDDGYFFDYKDSKNHHKKSWKQLCIQDICFSLRHLRKCNFNFADYGENEIEHYQGQDTNLYYLFYLLYLRLNCSRSKIEQIIFMTNEALNSYLDSLIKLKQEKDLECNNNETRINLMTSKEQQ